MGILYKWQVQGSKKPLMPKTEGARKTDPSVRGSWVTHGGLVGRHDFGFDFGPREAEKPGHPGAVVWHLPKDTPLCLWDQNWTHRNGKRLGAPTEDLDKTPRLAAWTELRTPRSPAKLTVSDRVEFKRMKGVTKPEHPAWSCVCSNGGSY